MIRWRIRVSERFQAIRGMNDVLPSEMSGWHQMEFAFKQCMSQYGYQEIRFPLLESTALFKRTIGEVTDIVEKEMYTFEDRNGQSVTLRPEGTAGCIRACIEHGLLHNQQQKLWYSGPLFRYERPQKGRYRQFNQFGVETFGFSGVGIELEILAICHRLWAILGLTHVVHLQINTLGELSERQAYRDHLVNYFKKNIEKLDEDSLRRLEQNPLRILDSKNPALKELIEAAPKLLDMISKESQNRFKSLCEGLSALGIQYEINPSLVRGLDYYGGLVFEWVTDQLGSQSAVCAGGRFDTLVEQLGGMATPAIGFGIGAERLLLLMEKMNVIQSQLKPPLVFLMANHEKALQQCVVLSERLRNALPDETILLNAVGGSFKSQFKKADKSGAHYAVLIGEEELTQELVTIKDLRFMEEQISIPQTSLIEYLQTRVKVKPMEKMNVSIYD